MDELVRQGDEAAPALPITIPDDLPGVSNALVPNQSAPPVARQRTSHTEAAKLESEKVVVAAPMSYVGSAGRIWRLTGLHPHPAARIGLGAVAIALVLCAWTVVTAWYVCFGLLLVPYRVIRRGQRKNKRESLRHREMLSAITEDRQR